MALLVQLNNNLLSYNKKLKNFFDYIKFIEKKTIYCTIGIRIKPSKKQKRTKTKLNRIQNVKKLEIF